MASSIHDDIRAINESLLKISGAQADNGATLRAMNERLFLPGGVIPAMWGEIKEVKKQACDANDLAVKVNGKVNNQRAYVAGFSACGLLLGGVVKSALAKLGVNF